MVPSFLDTSTTKLLTELQSDRSIIFESTNNDFCEVYQQDQMAIIYYNPKCATTECIAHELLHIWLSKFGYSIGNHLFNQSASHNKLSRIIDKNLCDHISNCCDHFKMYPRFISMGYSAKTFLKNGLALKASLLDITNLRLTVSNRINSPAVNSYIGCLIAILADHIENDYTQHHSAFKSAEPELYNIISKFWKEWEEFEIEKIDGIFISDRQLIYDLFNKLDQWSTNKEFI